MMPILALTLYVTALSAHAEPTQPSVTGSSTASQKNELVTSPSVPVINELENPKTKHDNPLINPKIEIAPEQPLPAWVSWNNIATLGTFISALTTLIIALITYYAAKSAKVSADAAKKAADCAERSIEVARDSYTASERPWISVEAKIGSDLVEEEHGIGFGVDFSVKNHGSSPARNVFIQYKVVTLKQNQFNGTRELIRQIAQSLSATNMGIQLFPFESQVISWKSPLTNDEIEEAYKYSMPPNNSLPSFYIIGSAFYQSTFSETLYNTDFIYNVIAIGDERFPRGCDVPIFEGRFPMHRIVLIPTPYYSGTIK